MWRGAEVSPGFDGSVKLCGGGAEVSPGFDGSVKLRGPRPEASPGFDGPVKLCGGGPRQAPVLMVGCVESHHRAGGSHLDLTQALSAVEKGGQIKEGKRQEKNTSTKNVLKW